ncbi:MAG TPA: helix-turn-helix domain-containing protein [Gemmatimonadaceae bacterium]|nr:helix-turn-helix domain-containing protein [Gemmatimonadaceae bacterium]
MARPPHPASPTRYDEYPPPPALARFVECLWTRAAAPAFLGVPANALTDQRVALDLVRPGAGERLARVAAEAEPGQRVDRVAAELRAMRNEALSPPPVVVAALAIVADTCGRLAVGPLCARLGVTRQHLARVFARHVGISPKTFGRVTRVRHVIRRAAGHRDVDWGRLALDAGYCDQSHLIGDFGELVGVSPTRWLTEG